MQVHPNWMEATAFQMIQVRIQDSGLAPHICLQNMDSVFTGTLGSTFLKVLAMLTHAKLLKAHQMQNYKR